MSLEKVIAALSNQSHVEISRGSKSRVDLRIIAYGKDATTAAEEAKRIFNDLNTTYSEED